MNTAFKILASIPLASLPAPAQPGAFAYRKDTDAWQWLMDGEGGGEQQPFARLALRKELHSP